MSPLSREIINWNNAWRYDYWYRDKYRIAFNSIEHRRISQIDIKFAFLEERLIEKDRASRDRAYKLEAEYKKDGKWLQINENVIDNKQLFDDIDINALE